MGSEERFDYWRRTIGLVAAPIVFVVFWALPVAGLSVEAHRLLAVLGAVVALDDGIDSAGGDGTARTGAVCVAGHRFCQEIFRVFADPIIFLFLAAF